MIFIIGLKISWNRVSIVLLLHIGDVGGCVIVAVANVHCCCCVANVVVVVVVVAGVMISSTWWRDLGEGSQ